MTSPERQPKRIPWYEDEEGWYFTILSDEGKFDIRPCNTDLYLHDEPYQSIDHLFYEHYTSEDEVAMGFRIWRGSVDTLLGDGMFDSLIDDMRARNFFVISADKPTDEDMKYYEQTFGEFQIPEQSIKNIAKTAMAGFDAEWAYYSEEWK